MAKQTILLVEDNPDDELLALRAFRKVRVESEVIVTHDGQEALDYVRGEGVFTGRDRRRQPKVIFLDINLPKRNGFEVLETIRGDRTTCLIPVVLLTSSDEEKDLIRGYSLGANSYVFKPVDFNQFVREVAVLTEYWLTMNRTPAII